MAQNNTNNTDWTALQQAEDMAYFRAEACLFSPESYSLEEKKAICDGVDSITDEIDSALKSDFESLPPFAQGKMLDLLKQADPANFEWWREVLVGKTPSCVSDISQACRAPNQDAKQQGSGVHTWPLPSHRTHEGGCIQMAEGRVVYITEVPKADEFKLFEHEPDIMTKQQVADLLGVNLKTISREIQRGRLGCIHVGTRVRITKTALLRYVEEQK